MAQEFVTQEQLKAFGTELENLVKQSIENEEVEYSKVVKEFVESKIADLEASLTNNPEWLKVKRNIQAIVEVFDSDKNGELTPAEILTKIGEIKGQVNTLADKLSEVEKRIDDINGKLGSVTTEITNAKDKIKEVENKIKETVSAGTNDIITEMTEVIKETYNKIVSNTEDRMAKVRSIFGLAYVEVSKDTKSNEAKAEDKTNEVKDKAAEQKDKTTQQKDKTTTTKQTKSVKNTGDGATL